MAKMDMRTLLGPDIISNFPECLNQLRTGNNRKLWTHKATETSVSLASFLPFIGRPSSASV